MGSEKSRWDTSSEKHWKKVDKRDLMKIYGNRINTLNGCLEVIEEFLMTGVYSLDDRYFNGLVEHYDQAIADAIIHYDEIDADIPKAKRVGKNPFELTRQDIVFLMERYKEISRLVDISQEVDKIKRERVPNPVNFRGNNGEASEDDEAIRDEDDWYLDKSWRELGDDRDIGHGLEDYIRE